jgi:hypothetical protein
MSVIQSGAVLAVLPLFKERLLMMADWRNPQSLEFNFKILIGFSSSRSLVVFVSTNLESSFLNQPASRLAAPDRRYCLHCCGEKLRDRVLADVISWPVVFMVAAARFSLPFFPALRVRVPPLFSPCFAA